MVFLFVRKILLRKFYLVNKTATTDINLNVYSFLPIKPFLKVLLSGNRKNSKDVLIPTDN